MEGVQRHLDPAMAGPWLPSPGAFGGLGGRVGLACQAPGGAEPCGQGIERASWGFPGHSSHGAPEEPGGAGGPGPWGSRPGHPAGCFIPRSGVCCGRRSQASGAPQN